MKISFINKLYFRFWMSGVPNVSVRLFVIETFQKNVSIFNIEVVSVRKLNLICTLRDQKLKIYST